MAASDYHHCLECLNDQFGAQTTKRAGYKAIYGSDNDMREECRIICDEHLAEREVALREQVATLTAERDTVRAELAELWRQETAERDAAYADVERLTDSLVMMTGERDQLQIEVECAERTSSMLLDGVERLTAERDHERQTVVAHGNYLTKTNAHVDELRADNARHLKTIATLREAGVDAIRDAHNRGIHDGHPMSGRSEGTADIVKEFLDASKEG